MQCRSVGGSLRALLTALCTCSVSLPGTRRLVHDVLTFGHVCMQVTATVACLELFCYQYYFYTFSPHVTTRLKLVNHVG